jgi:hypothetical protein
MKNTSRTILGIFVLLGIVLGKLDMKNLNRKIRSIEKDVSMIEYDTDTLTQKTNCYVTVDNKYTYDLTKFVNHTGPVNFEDKPGFTFYYTLCGYNSIDCKGNNTHATIFTLQPGSCEKVTSNSYYADLIDSNNYEKGFTINF